MMKKFFLVLFCLIPFLIYGQTDSTLMQIQGKATLNDTDVLLVSTSDTVYYKITYAQLKALLNVLYKANGTYLIPSDSTSFRTFSNLKYQQSGTYLIPSDTTGNYVKYYQAPGSVDTSIVRGIIYLYLEDSSGTSTHTVEEIDDAVDSVTILNNRVAVLENTVTSLQNSINNILAALDTCGCSASTADNTPPLKPTNYVAVGGTSQTQYVTTWTDPVASDLDSIRWYEGSSNDTTAMTWITSIAAGTETYTRTGRTANTTYWSAIKAVDDSGNVSYFSNVDSATTLPTGGVSPIATLDFEEGNLSEWSSTSGANLSASTTVAHGGTYSMRVGTNSYGIFNFTSDTEVWLTFWVYLPSTSSQSNTTNYIAMFDNGIADRTCMGTVWGGGSTWQEWIVGRNSGDLVDDDITTNFSENTWHKVKIYYQTNGTTTSQHQVWIDDTSIWSLSSVYTGAVQNFTVGSEAATITNWFYIDDIKLYDTDPGTQD